MSERASERASERVSECVCVCACADVCVSRTASRHRGFYTAPGMSLLAAERLHPAQW